MSSDTAAAGNFDSGDGAGGGGGDCGGGRGEHAGGVLRAAEFYSGATGGILVLAGASGVIASIASFSRRPDLRAFGRACKGLHGDPGGDEAVRKAVIVGLREQHTYLTTRYLAFPATRTYHSELRTARERDWPGIRAEETRSGEAYPGLVADSDTDAIGGTIRISGAQGPDAHAVNGVYDYWSNGDEDIFTRGFIGDGKHVVYSGGALQRPGDRSSTSRSARTLASRCNVPW